jgi:F-type H+-transporting ATPase subunit b
MINLALIAVAAAAAEEAGGGGLMSLRVNLMFWTLVIFAILYFILNKWAFPAVLGMVEAREKALAEAIDGAKRDREEAARLLADHRQQIENARGDAQKLIAEARGVAEKMKSDVLEKTRVEQQEMLERARRDIGVERDKAIVELRREAVDLAIRGASRVVEENLDSDKNRKLVEQFLSTLSVEGHEPKAGSR